MAEATTLDEFLGDNHDAIIAAVQARMRGDETMGRIAVQREISESELTAQVLGFWLQAIRSDLTLGSTATVRQGVQWLVSLRSGHELPFDDALVLRMFDDISDEIEGRLESEELRAEYAAYRHEVGKLMTGAPPGETRPDVKLEGYVDHLLAGRDEECLAAGRETAVDLDGLHRLYVELIGPSQYRVGELWESGRISVAREHLATAINSSVATQCYAPLACVSSGGPRALVACTPDEMHELGPRMLADLLECDGWDVDFYGTSMPLRDLIGAIRERKPRFVGLSAALVMHLGSLKRTITAIREAFGVETPPIVVGGNAFRSDPDLCKRVGADMYAVDASAAVEMLRGLKKE